MSYEAYNAFATAVKEEISLMNHEEQLGILTIIVNAMNSRKQESAISNAEKISLFEKFKGSMKVGDNFDAKKELMEALDERYDV